MILIRLTCLNGEYPVPKLQRKKQNMSYREKIDQISNEAFHVWELVYAMPGRDVSRPYPPK